MSRKRGHKTKSAGHSVPAAPHLGRLTALTVALSGLCLGVLGVNFVEERSRLISLQNERLAAIATNAGQILAANPASAFTPNTPGFERARAALKSVAPENGTVCMVNTGRTGFACGGNAPRLAFTPAGFAPLWQNAGVASIRTVEGQRAQAVARALPNGTSVVAIAPPARGMIRLAVPYLVAGISILALSAAFLAAAGRLRLAVARIEGEKKYLLNRLTGPEYAGCGVWKADRDGVTLPGSLRGALDLSRSDHTYSYAGLRGVVHPDDIARAIGIFMGDDDNAEGTIRLRTSTREWQSVYIRAVFAEDGRRGIAVPVGPKGFSTDDNDKAIARLRETLEALPQAFVLWDANGRLLAWNRTFTDLFAVDHDTLKVGMTVRDTAHATEASKDLLYEHFAPPTDDTTSADVRFPDDRYMRVERRPTVGDGWVVIANDVTDERLEAECRERNERELQMTVDILEKSRRDLGKAMQGYQVEKQRAQDANRAKSEFLAHMSHELRTPLNAINGFSELMKEELYGPLGHPKYAEYISDIHGSGHHLLALINDILDLSKIEAGKMDLQLTQMELEKTLQEGLRFIAPQMKSSSVNLRAMVEHVPSVWADTRAVKQIFINLLSNAEKFTGDGGSVTVTTLVDLSSVTILVADTGIGIPSEHLDRIGQPFELVEDHFAKSRRGSGLGLALSKALAEAQGGILAIASEAGRGTIAALTLPRRPGVEVTLPTMLRERARILTAPSAIAPEEQTTETPDATPIVAPAGTLLN